MNFNITNRWTGSVIFESEIEASDETPLSIRIGMAVKVAVKARANLADAYLADANLADAYLAGANLARAVKVEPDEIPIIPNIDATILAEIEKSRAAGGAGLEMGDWHTCDTTHCRGGWAIHLGGKKGLALERKVGQFMAACLIYQASRHGAAPPHFYASNEAAMADIRACAARQRGEAQP